MDKGREAEVGMKRNRIARRNALTAAWAGILLLAACLPASSALAAEGGCANEARRVEQSSAYLPNCRAYEQVTPLAKDSGEPLGVQVGLEERAEFRPIEGGHAAEDGNRMAWVSEYSLPGLAGDSTLGLDYLSTRGPDGWSTEATLPPQSPENGVLCEHLDGIVGWSSNLTKGILADGDAQEAQSSLWFLEQGFDCGHPEPALREADGTEIREPQGFQNLFLRDSEADSYQLINVTPNAAPRPTPAGESPQPYHSPEFLAGSAELNHVAFEDELPLTEEAEQLSPTVEAACKEEPKGRACWEGHDDLYVWSEGQQPAVRLVSMLPDGKPVEGALAGTVGHGPISAGAGVERPWMTASYLHAVSADGSRIFFEAEGNLYARENGGQPQSAIVSGSTAVNGEQCTEPANACTIQLDVSQGGSGSGGGRWLAASEDGARVFFTDEQDLTSTATATTGDPDLYEYDFEAPQGERVKDLTVDAAEPADVLGVSGASDDGSYVYFVADGVLPNSGENSQTAVAQAGQPNLYVSHEGAVRFIATMATEDVCDWACSSLTARVSGNGQYLAFNSVSQLTGYANAGPACAPVYSGEFHELTGYAPGSCEEIYLYEAAGGQLACVSCKPGGAPPSGDGAVIDMAARTDTDAQVATDYPQRNVSESGEVFFETAEALLPQQDTNGIRDVYEYEHGTLHLISSGTSSSPSYFLDATPSGSDVFFVTAQKLLPRDTEDTYNIYDARIGGGFAEPSALVPPCESEGCKGAAGTPTIYSTPGSTTFTGPGDIAQATSTAKAKVKKKSKKKKKTRKAKKTKALKGKKTAERRRKAKRRDRGGVGR